MHAILCPLKSELTCLRQALGDNQFIMAVGGHGKVNYAMKATQLLLENPDIKTLFCVGGGGALAKEVSVLDVVVAERTIEHDYYEKFDPEENLPQVKGDAQILSRLNSFRSDKFNLHRGIIASGDEDIISSQRANEVMERTGAIAVAWEGMGGAKVCRQLGKSFIEIRGMTDSCQSTASADFSKNLPQSMAHVAEVLRYLIDQGL